MITTVFKLINNIKMIVVHVVNGVIGMILKIQGKKLQE